MITKRSLSVFLLQARKADAASISQLSPVLESEAKCNRSAFARPFRVWTPRHTRKPIPSLFRFGAASRNCTDDEVEDSLVRLADVKHRHRAGGECAWRWVCRAVDDQKYYPATWWQAELINADCAGGTGFCVSTEVQVPFLQRQGCRNRWLWYVHLVPVAATCRQTMATIQMNTA